MTKTCNQQDTQNKRSPGRDLSYTCGCQRSTDGIFIPYQNHGKVFIYFALMGRVKIYGPPGIHLKNKNIFATMISLMNKGISIPHLSPIAIT